MSAPTSGRVYEDFEIGQVLKHPLGRTITTTDNTWFTLLTNNPNPIHFDHAFAAQTEWKQPLVNSAFTIALVTGLTVSDLSQNAVNLGWDKVRLPKPLFEGETVYAQSEVLAKRESESRPHQGIVHFKTTGFTEAGKVIITFERTMLVYKSGQVPPKPELPEIEG
ncbi:MAG: MaoC family dehydratase [Acidobacteriota bacterium]